MDIVYKNNEIKSKCISIKVAKKYFDSKTAKKLIKRIDFIDAAENLEDVISYPALNFHDLKGKLDGLYALDIDGRKSSYRLIVSFDDYSKDEVFHKSKYIEIVNVMEVSNHYE